MKKIVATLATCLLFLAIFSCCYALEEQTVEGGSTFAEAVTLYPGIVYRISLSGNSAGFGFDLDDRYVYRLDTSGYNWCFIGFPMEPSNGLSYENGSEGRDELGIVKVYNSAGDQIEEAEYDYSAKRILFNVSGNDFVYLDFIVGVRSQVRGEDIISICLDENDDAGVNNTHIGMPVEQLISEATCTEDGVYMTEQCRLCGAVVDWTAIPATGHTSIETVIIAQPSCTENGLQANVCTVCGEHISEDTIPATGHNYTDWAPRNDGYEERYCQNCGDYETRQMEASSENTVAETFTFRGSVTFGMTYNEVEAAEGYTGAPGVSSIVYDTYVIPDTAVSSFIASLTHCFENGKLMASVYTIENVDYSAVNNLCVALTSAYGESNANDMFADNIQLFAENYETIDSSAAFDIANCYYLYGWELDNISIYLVPNHSEDTVYVVYIAPDDVLTHDVNVDTMGL